MSENLVIIGLAVLALGASLIAALCAGCDNQSQSRSTTWTGQTIETIAHDGHTFVVSSRGGIIHHPGCACRK